MGQQVSCEKPVTPVETSCVEKEVVNDVEKEVEKEVVVDKDGMYVVLKNDVVIAYIHKQDLGCLHEWIATQFNELKQEFWFVFDYYEEYDCMEDTEYFSLFAKGKGMFSWLYTNIQSYEIRKIEYFNFECEDEEEDDEDCEDDCEDECEEQEDEESESDEEDEQQEESNEDDESDENEKQTDN